MSLDLTKVASQIESMVANLAQSSEDRRKRRQMALALLNDAGGRFDALKDKIGRSRGKVTFLVPDLYEPLAAHFPAPPVPEDFTVIGGDGSHIDVDRHRQAGCFLINIGAASLSYGEKPDAALTSFPHLYFGDENTHLLPPKGAGGREFPFPIEGPLLGVKRSIHEVEKLAELASRLPESSLSLALMDGSLILWGLASKDLPSFVRETLLDGGFLPHLDNLKAQNNHKQLTLAGYVSFPRSTDVVSALRVARCPQEVPDCDRYCQDTPFGERECDDLSGVLDRELFGNLLGCGERSALFVSGSSINRRYREHRIYFFYLRLEDEIARVEVPEWVVGDKELLLLTHALTLDQCRRGFGYPVALSEAHEQAVVSTADRENFWLLAESALEIENLPAFGSAKNFIKKTRWV